MTEYLEGRMSKLGLHFVLLLIFSLHLFQNYSSSFLCLFRNERE